MVEIKEKLERCGQCGEWLQDPRLYTEEEQNNAELTYCGNCYTESVGHRVSRDMAIDAGNPDLEGQMI